MRRRYFEDCPSVYEIKYENNNLIIKLKNEFKIENTIINNILLNSYYKEIIYFIYISINIT